MKVYLESKLHPWVTWDSDLWSSDPNSTFTSVQSEADWQVLEWEPDEVGENGKNIAWYIESISDAEIKDFIESQYPMHPLPLVLSDSVDVIQRFEEEGWQHIARWNKPTRVSPKMWYSGPVDTESKNGGFVITSNGGRAKDNLNEILKTYFAMCLQDDPEHEGELTCMQDVDIFSAYELPFETFNNINFHGLQPNPKMFKKIKSAKLFISPYRGDGVPINAIDAIMLGTPVIVRDTEVNRSVFNWDDRCFYKTEEELAKKIKFFSEVETTDEEYQRIVNDGYNAMIQSHAPSISIESLIFTLKGGRNAT